MFGFDEEFQDDFDGATLLIDVREVSDESGAVFADSENGFRRIGRGIKAIGSSDIGQRLPFEVDATAAKDG